MSEQALLMGNRTELFDRAAVAVAQAESACRRARALIEVACELQYQHWPRMFSVTGTVDSFPVHAFWHRGQLSLSPLLWRRAELIVALGDEFHDDERERSVSADLTEPLPALLTLMRACDRVQRISLDHPPRQEHVRGHASQ